MDQPRKSLTHRVRAWPRRVLIALGVILLLLVAARIALPHVVRHQINDRLQEIPGYRGSVDNISIHLIRGAYSIHGISIYRLNGAQPEPFFLAEHIDFSLAWRELFRGRIVSDILVEKGELTIVKGPTPETSQKDTDKRWQSVVEDLFPIDIQRFEIARGMIRYVDDTRTPAVDVYIKNMHMIGTGLRNRPDETGAEYPAQIQVQGDSLGAGKLSLLINAEPLAEKPHFHLSLKLEHVNLPALNETMRSVANVDVAKGMFDLVVEMAAQDGAFQGYVKPFFTDLDFEAREDKKGSILAHVWERIVSGVAWLVKNKSRDQVATRIPFQGEFGDTEVGVWATVRNIFRHGFVRAFNPVVEGSLDPDNVPPPEQIAPGKANAGDQRKAQRKLEQDNDAKAP